MSRIWALATMLALSSPVALHAQVIFSDNFESYTGQLPNSDPNNTNPL